MKVKTLFKTLSGVDYILSSETGNTLEIGYISCYHNRPNGYTEGKSRFEDWKVKTITTLANNDRLYITIF